jgi:hypothetical protein
LCIGEDASTDAVTDITIRYCVLFFFETYAFARKEHSIGLIHDYEAGKLPVRIPFSWRLDTYRDIQRKILRESPFSDDTALLATHHCISLIVSCLRFTMPPRDGPIDDKWIGALLVSSGFERLVEFFSAEIGDGQNPRAERREFMLRFHKDVTTHERDETEARIYENPELWPRQQPLNEVWFSAASQEMQVRGLIPHNADKYTEWNGFPIWTRCEGCRAAGSSWRVSGWMV